MVPFAIAGIQMTVSATQSNLAAMTQRVDVLMHRFPWVQMVVFSELCVLGPLRSTAQPLPGPTEQAFCELAARHGIWLIPGSLFERVDDRVYNTVPVIDPEGAVIGRYRKMFPFQPYEQGIEPGHEFLVFDVPGGRPVRALDLLRHVVPRDLAHARCARRRGDPAPDAHRYHRPRRGALDRARHRRHQPVLRVRHQRAGRWRLRQIEHRRSLGPLLYSAGAGEEMIPVEIDLERVRRERAVGIQGLGQPLKSFRDRRVEFDVYRPEVFDNSYLESLGTLERAGRGSRAGLAAATGQAGPAGAAVAYRSPAEAESAD